MTLTFKVFNLMSCVLSGCCNSNVALMVFVCTQTARVSTVSTVTMVGAYFRDTSVMGWISVEMALTREAAVSNITQSARVFSEKISCGTASYPSMQMV